MIRIVPLQELYKVGSSKRVLKSQWKTEGVPFYRGREITKISSDGFVENELFISENDYLEYSRRYGVPQSGDILITAIGTIGNSYIVTESDRFYFKDASVLWLKKESDTESEYINYWLKSPGFFDQLDKGNGATVDTLTIKKLQSVSVPLPPLPEQKRIVAILDEAFAAIEKAKANAERNLENAREVFEGVLKSTFSHTPNDWINGKLQDLTMKIGSGATPKGGSKAYKSEGISLIRSLNVHDLEFRPKNLAFIDGDQAKRLSNVVVEKRDVLLNITGASVARCCLVPESALPARVNQHVSIIRPKRDKLVSGFLHYLLISDPYKERLLYTGNKGGATRQAITKAQIQDFEISYPSNLEKQRTIVEELNSLLEESTKLVEIISKKSRLLDILRQSLLHKAFIGELTSG